MWCGHLTEKVLECDGFSYPCFYKLLCSASIVCDHWKDEFCGGQTSLIQGKIQEAVEADEWIRNSLGHSHSFGKSPTEHMALAMSKRAKIVGAFNVDASKVNSNAREEVDADVDGLSGLDASVKGKCVG
jgi:hypothetical protein